VIFLYFIFHIPPIPPPIRKLNPLNRKFGGGWGGRVGGGGGCGGGGVVGVGAGVGGGGAEPQEQRLVLPLVASNKSED